VLDFEINITTRLVLAVDGEPNRDVTHYIYYPVWLFY